MTNVAPTPGTWVHRIEMAVAHAAGWILAKLHIAQKDVTTIERDDPLVAEAVKMGEAYATAHGVPVDQIKIAADDVVKIVQAVAKDAPAAPAAADGAPA